MATTVTYKNTNITTVNNETKTLETAGTYLEDDITLVDITSGGTYAGDVTQDENGYIVLSDEDSGAIVVDGNELLWAPGSYDISTKATAEYIWPFPVRAYINTSNYYWSFYNDSSTSFCFNIIPGKTYTIIWDNDYTSSLYRIAFTKSENVPSYTSSTTSRITVYDAAGVAGIEQNGFVSSYTFTATDDSIKLCVIQINGTTDLWTSGTIRSWFIEVLSHLTILEA